MSKKVRNVIVTLCIIALLVAVGIGAYIFAKPYVNAYTTLKNIANEDYSYEIECYIEGVILKEGSYGNYTVFVEGEKENDKLRSYVYSEEEAYLEVFANADGDVLFNVRPTCQYLANKLEEVLGVSYGELDIDIDDTYISLSDIEEIIGMDIIGIDDFGVSGSDEDRQYNITRIDKPENINVQFDGGETYFFQLTLEDLGTKVIVGVPEKSDDEFLYIDLEKDDIKLEMYVKYNKNENISIDFPQSSLNEEHIEAFGNAYKIWLLGRKLSGK